MWVLVGAVALSLSAQVVEAERSIIGWLAAALPAAGFLALVKIVLTRTPASARPAGAQAPEVAPAAAEPPGDQVITVDPARQLGPVGRTSTVPVPPDAFARANGAIVHSGAAR
jgi:hypothetical protein